MSRPFAVGRRANNSWVNKSGEELFTQIRATMPAETPGSLSDDEYYDVTAFILASANIAIDGGMISHAAINALSIQPGEAAPATSAADSTAGLTTTATSAPIATRLSIR